MKQHYRFACVLRPDLSNAKVHKLLEDIFNRIENNCILKSEGIGVENLAYPIKQYKQGHRYFADLYLSKEKVETITKLFNINEEILRFIFVKLYFNPDSKFTEADLKNGKVVNDMVFAVNWKPFTSEYGRILPKKSSTKVSTHSAIARNIKRCRYMAMLYFKKTDNPFMSTATETDNQSVSTQA